MTEDLEQFAELRDELAQRELDHDAELDNLATDTAFARSQFESERRRMTVRQRRRQQRRTVALAVLLVVIVLAGLELALGSDGPLGSFAGS